MVTGLAAVTPGFTFRFTISKMIILHWTCEYESFSAHTVNTFWMYNLESRRRLQNKTSERPLILLVSHKQAGVCKNDMLGVAFRSVGRAASHIQRLCPRCSGPGFESWTGALCCMYVPLSLTLFLSFL